MEKKSFLLGTLTGVMTRGQVFVTPRESLTKIPYQNALEFLAFGKDLIGDRLRLDILTRIFTRIFN